MEGKLEIKDRKLIVEIPFDQEHADVVLIGLLGKAKAVGMEFIMKEHFEKKQKELIEKKMTGIIKPGEVVH